MSAIQFLGEWAIRSSILTLSGAILLRASRVRDASIRLAAWTAVLGGSLAIPALTAVFPGVSFPVVHKVILTESTEVAFPRARHTKAVDESAPGPPAVEAFPNDGLGASHSTGATAAGISRSFDWSDWRRAAPGLYVLICAGLLLRIFTGLAMGLLLLRRSHTTGRTIEGILILESDRLGAPATLGVVRPSIVLPIDWRDWGKLKLEAVLAHELSHVRRWDPAVQLLSAIHRALLWISPLSWFLHRRIIRTAEEAGDDAAVAVTRDRASYAETLLDFMQRGVWSTGPPGVPMARYGNPDHRIHRILDETVLSRGVTRRGLAAIVALGSPLAYVVATAQPRSSPQAQAPIAQVSPAPPVANRPSSISLPPQAGRSTTGGPVFETADIHTSAPNTMPAMRSSFSRGRYELRNATIVDLIRTAWSVDADNVVGGPEWLDTDRYDVVATAPAGSTPEALKTMLQGLLKDRFQLSVHSANKNLPAYAMTVGGKPQLKQADGSEEKGCSIQPGNNPPEPVVFTCRNMTMAAFASQLANVREASGYLFNYPVVDRTGLKGAWNFTVKWSPRVAMRAYPTPAETITIFDAFEKQLGLKLEFGKVPTPVVVVDRANPPRVTENRRAPMEFEVASIKPDAPGTPCPPSVAIQPGGRVRINMTLKWLIVEAWGADIPPGRIVLGPKSGGPKSIDDSCFTVVAKAPVQENAVAGWNGPLWNGVDIDSMRMMLRALLMDRFKLAAHTEDRPVSGYELLASNPRAPKLRKADPSNRPGCREGPGDDGKDPRVTNPVVSRLITCRNMTIAQFAAEMNKLFVEFPRLTDSTGIAGRYDMTINFSPSAVVQNAAGRDGVASEPDGTISLSEALSGQLGLKLQSRKVMAPVLVIDRMNEMPTEN